MKTEAEIHEAYNKLVNSLRLNTGGENGHWTADYQLLEFIEFVMDNKDATDAFEKIPHMWYA